MDIRKHIGSKWLKAKDIDPDADTIVTIVDVVLDQVEDEETGSVDELVGVRFDEIGRKQLGLNTTNGEILEDMFGWETAKWVGNRIALYVDPDVRFKGQRVDAIRIRPRKPSPKAVKRKAKRSVKTKREKSRRAADGDGD